VGISVLLVVQRDPTGSRHRSADCRDRNGDGGNRGNTKDVHRMVAGHAKALPQGFHNFREIGKTGPIAIPRSG
jgi:hypothetical protein